MVTAEIGTLAYCVQRFHERHPDFVAILPCVEPAAVFRVVPRRVLVTATRIGITIEEFRRREADGWRWCNHGGHWAPDWWKDGKRTHAYCKPCMPDYRRLAALLRAERVAS